MVYVRFRDSLGNTTAALSDDIYLNTLIQNNIVEVNSAGTIVTQYESESDPLQTLYSPVKTPEQTGTFIAEPFFASTVNRWDDVMVSALLPAGTEFDLYVRTANTREDLLVADWVGPYTLDNTSSSDLVYYESETYGYVSGEYGYSDSSYYYDTGGEVSTLTADIDTLTGDWLQWRIVLKTSTKDETPVIYSVVVNYVAANASYFYTTVFDLDVIAAAERAQDAGIEMRRGLVTYQGSYPDGGAIRFGIATSGEDTTDWSDYQEITPDRAFEVTAGTQFKLGIMLISTETESAIIDEYAILWESGARDVKPNLNAY